MERHPSVLVTGGNGQVARALRALIPRIKAPAHEELDVTDEAAVSEAIAGTDHVVHLAALTNVDLCEREPDRATQINVKGTQNVVRSAAAARSRVIFLSTDYVFDGRSDRAYREEDDRRPVNFYGITKAEAEDAVEETVASLTIRSSWIFGDGRNFVSSILAAARDGSPLRIVDDQRGLPTPADAVARAIAFAIDQRLEGLLHIAGDGPVASWADVAERALQFAGMDATVERISTEEYVRSSDAPVAPRPPFSALDLTRAQRIGVPLLDWRDGLKNFVERSS